ncbi:MAG: diguanylate cyclase domain protein [Labilithrix sp.]|nr:diguanylate cyclase domain protein [Labilithrix sp.]
MAGFVDPVTCLAIATLMALLNGGILGLVHRDLPEALRPSAVDWRISTLLMAGGSIFLAVQAYGPPGFILPLANGMLVLGLTGYWRALRRFYGEPDTPWLLVPPVLGTVGVYWFAAQQPSLTARVVVVSVLWVVVLVGAIRTLHRGADGAMSRRVLAGIFLVVTIFMAVRAFYFALAPAALSSVVDRGSWINLVTLMVAGVLPVIGTTAFLLLCSDRIRRQWERAASTDYLTGLANRRTLGTEGELRLERARANGDQLAVAVVDVDHFKSINDSYGHDIGDLALKHVASRLRAVCRGGDLPARQGGEEFVVLLDRIEGSQAKSAGERMRRAVEAQPFVAEGIERTITVSIGVAALSSADRHFDDLLRRADLALYAAKGGGRNRVELAE